MAEPTALRLHDNQSFLRPTRTRSTSIKRADDGASKGKNANLNGALAHLMGYACRGKGAFFGSTNNCTVPTYRYKIVRSLHGTVLLLLPGGLCFKEIKIAIIKV
eukprot:scaffold1386_cov55-Attheya_sp.AAC.2